MRREERAVHYAGEPLAAMLEEPSNSWEKDSVSGDEAAGEARGREGPAQTATLEETMEALLRVASPDIPALVSNICCSIGKIVSNTMLIVGIKVTLVSDTLLSDVAFRF